MKTPSAPALERALTLLEQLAASRRGLSLAELARQLGLPKSSVHCLLVTLERRGYLLRNARTTRYLFGLRLFSLANMALKGLELREQAAPILRELAETTSLTAHLAIIEQDEAVLVEKVEPPGAYKLATWIGKRMDVHCTALGKAMIAYWPEDELAKLIRAHGLPRHNDNTIVSARKLKQDLERVRLRGFSLDDEEDEVGYRCIGAAVFDPAGAVVAAISVSGSVDRVTAENARHFAADVRTAAAALTSAVQRPV